MMTRTLTLSQDYIVAKQAKPDSYFCTTFHPLKEDIYITKISTTEHVTSKLIHHIILNVHESPYLEDAVKIKEKNFRNFINSMDSFDSVDFNDTYSCKHDIYHDPDKENFIMYAWAMDAKPLILPDDSAFKVKKGYSFQLEVHYLNAVSKIKGQEEISPGLELEILSSNQKPEYLVGTWYVGAEEFEIPPFTANYPVDISAKVPRDLTIFAARVHAHQWSKTNTAYVKRKKKENELQMIIQGVPHWPQEFYKRVAGPIQLYQNERIYCRCVYTNNLPEAIEVGSDQNDEMCNFYFLYLDKYEEFNQLDPVDSRNLNLGATIPLDSFVLPKFAGYSGEGDDFLKTTVDRPKFVRNIGMTANFQASNSEINQYSQFLQGPKIKNPTAITLDKKGNYLFILHRANRPWQDHSFIWKKVPDTKNFFKKSSTKMTAFFNRKFYKNQKIGETTIKVVDAKTGQEVKDFGENVFLMPHGIHVDANNEFLYVTDVGANKVFRTNFVQNIGRYTFSDSEIPTFEMFNDNKKMRWEIFADQEEFCLPTDIASTSDGNYIFIADGYCNNRIAMFEAKTGKLLKKFSSSKFGTNANNQDIVHSIALFENLNKICAASRDNGKIICFDLETTKESEYFFQDYKKIGHRIYAIRKIQNGNKIIGVNGPLYEEDLETGIDRVKPQVFILDVITGQIDYHFDFGKNSTGGDYLISPHLIDVFGRNLYVADLENGILASLTEGWVDNLLPLEISRNLGNQENVSTMEVTNFSSRHDASRLSSLTTFDVKIHYQFWVPCFITVIISFIYYNREAIARRRISQYKKIKDGLADQS